MTKTGKKDYAGYVVEGFVQPKDVCNFYDENADWAKYYNEVVKELGWKPGERIITMGFKTVTSDGEIYNDNMEDRDLSAAYTAEDNVYYKVLPMVSLREIEHAKDGLTTPIHVVIKRYDAKRHEIETIVDTMDVKIAQSKYIKNYGDIHELFYYYLEQDVK